MATATTGEHPELQVCDARTGRVVACIPWTGGPVRRLALSSDGRRLAGAGKNANVWIGEVATGAQLARIGTRRPRRGRWQSLSVASSRAAPRTSAAVHAFAAPLLRARAGWNWALRRGLPILPQRHVARAPVPPVVRASHLPPNCRATRIR